MKPIIAVTVNNTFQSEFAVADKLGFHGQEWDLLAHDYIREIEIAGGVPVMLPVYRLTEESARIIEMCDGIVFSGGRNTHPRYFGEEFTDSITSNNPWRDKWELALGKRVLFESDIPVLGICRGIQILNVAAGGTLYQNVVKGGKDYHASCINMPSFQPSHDVILAEGSRIKKVMGENSIYTNSFHTMGVKDLGKSWKATGTTKDGLVEIMEQDRTDRYCIAMQFHPEVMSPVFPEFRKIFNSFVQACAEYGAAKSKSK